MGGTPWESNTRGMSWVANATERSKYSPDGGTTEMLGGTGMLGATEETDGVGGTGGKDAVGAIEGCTLSAVSHDRVSSYSVLLSEEVALAQAAISAKERRMEVDKDRVEEENKKAGARRNWGEQGGRARFDTRRGPRGKRQPRAKG